MVGDLILFANELRFWAIVVKLGSHAHASERADGKASCALAGWHTARTDDVHLPLLARSSLICCLGVRGCDCITVSMWRSSNRVDACSRVELMAAPGVISVGESSFLKIKSQPARSSRDAFKMLFCSSS